MKIGHSILPQIQVPALVKGEMKIFDFTSLKGRWGILCCLPPLDFCEAVILNQYHRHIQNERTALLGMLPFANPVPVSHLPKVRVLNIPLLTDPLQRIPGWLGLSGPPSGNQCQSFIFDRSGVFRYHLVHRLAWRGLSFLLEILKHCQELYSHPSKSLPSLPVTLHPSWEKLSPDSLSPVTFKLARSQGLLQNIAFAREGATHGERR